MSSFTDTWLCEPLSLLTLEQLQAQPCAQFLTGDDPAAYPADNNEGHEWYAVPGQGAVPYDWMGYVTDPDLPFDTVAYGGVEQGLVPAAEMCGEGIWDINPDLYASLSFERPPVDSVLFTEALSLGPLPGLELHGLGFPSATPQVQPTCIAPWQLHIQPPAYAPAPVAPAVPAVPAAPALLNAPSPPFLPIPTAVPTTPSHSATRRDDRAESRASRRQAPYYRPTPSRSASPVSVSSAPVSLPALSPPGTSPSSTASSPAPLTPPSHTVVSLAFAASPPPARISAKAKAKTSKAKTPKVKTPKVKAPKVKAPTVKAPKTKAKAKAKGTKGVCAVPTKPRVAPRRQAYQIGADETLLDPIEGSMWCPYRGLCEYPKKFATYVDLNRHITTHSDKMFFHCGGVSATASGLAPAALEQLPCWEFNGVLYYGGCGGFFSRKDSLSRHLRATDGRCCADVNAPYQDCPY